MARLLGDDFDEKRPKLSFCPESKAWFDKVGQELWIENRKRDRADPLYPRGLGNNVGFSGGYRFPEPPQKLCIQMEPWDGALPDFLSSTNLFSDRVKNEVERIEPDVHQYFPINVILADATRIEQGYWLFNCMHSLDSLVLEHSEYMYEAWASKEKFPNYSYYAELGGKPPVLALNKALVAGKVKWGDYKLSKTFISDDFAAFLDANGIKGWEEMKYSHRAAIIEV